MRQRRSYSKNSWMGKPEHLAFPIKNPKEIENSILEFFRSAPPVSFPDRIEGQLASLLSEPPCENRTLDAIKEDAKDILSSFGVLENAHVFDAVMEYIDGGQPWEKPFKDRSAHIASLGTSEVLPKKREFGLDVGEEIRVEPSRSPEECCRLGKTFGCDLTATFYYNPNADDPDSEKTKEEVRLEGIPLQCRNGEFIVKGKKRVFRSILQAPVMRATKSKRQTRYTVALQIEGHGGSTLLVEAKYHDVSQGEAQLSSKDGVFVSMGASKDDCSVPLIEFLDGLGIEGEKFLSGLASQPTSVFGPLLEHMKKPSRRSPSKEGSQKVAKKALKIHLSKPEMSALFDRLYCQRGEKNPRSAEAGNLEPGDLQAIVSYLVDLMEGTGTGAYLDSVSGMGPLDFPPRALESLRVRHLDVPGDLYLEEICEGLDSFLTKAKDRAFSRKYLGTSRDTLDASTLFEGAPQVSFRDAAARSLSCSGKGEMLEDCNPLSALSHTRKVVKDGINRLAGEEDEISRDIFHSHFGRICPIETPESEKVGIVCSRALGCSLDEEGFLQAPFYRVENGKVLFGEGIIELSVAAEDVYRRADGVLRIADGANLVDEDGDFTEPERVSCRCVGRLGDIVAIEDVPAEDVDLMDAYSGQVGSVAANLIPFLAHDDATRALMAARQMKQAVPLLFPQAPLVATGLEALVADESGAVMRARQPGKVVYVDAERVEVESEDSGVIENYILFRNDAGNDGTGQTQRPCVALGDIVSAGDIVAEGPACHEGELALGANLVVAYMPWEGYNFEDAIVASERLVKDEVLTSVQAYSFNFDFRDKAIEICNPLLSGSKKPNVLVGLEESAYAHLGKDGHPVVGRKVSPGDIIIGAIRKNERGSDAALYGGYSDKSFRAPLTCEGIVTNVIVLESDEAPEGIEKRVVITVAQKRQLSVGDKLAGRHGNKGVVSVILPEEDMPYLADGTPVDLLLNPLGVPSRMNVGQLYELHMGWAASRKSRLAAAVGSEAQCPSPGFIETPSFGGADADDVLQAIRDANSLERKLASSRNGDGEVSGNCVFVQQLGDEPGGDCGKACVFDGRTGKMFPGRFAVGTSYIMKLNMMAHDKISSRSSDNSRGYDDLTRQPRKGRRNGGGQRFGHMEVWALMAHGAAFNLYEMASVKSDGIKARESLRKDGDADRALSLAFRDHGAALELLQSELRALCIDFRLDDTHIGGPRCSISVASDGTVRDWGGNGLVSHREKPKKLALSKNQDGLFSKDIFGSGMAARTRFGLIELDAPVVHPFYKDLVSECVGCHDEDEFREMVGGGKVLIDLQAEELPGWLDSSKAFFEGCLVACADGQVEEGPSETKEKREEYLAGLLKSLAELSRAKELRDGLPMDESEDASIPRTFSYGRYALIDSDVVLCRPGLKRESWYICAQIAEVLLDEACAGQPGNKKAALNARYLDVLQKLNREGVAGEQRRALLARARNLAVLLSEGCNPRSMTLRALPVLPAGLRPSITIQGESTAHDTSILYNKILKANDDLKALDEKDLDDAQRGYAKRLCCLQQAVDELFGPAFKMSGKSNRRKRKGISENLAGKKGRIRGNLLGRREDYSARAVISIDPTLAIDECGLPVSIAFDLFSPFVSKLLLDRFEDIADASQAEREIRQRTQRACETLFEVMEGKRVLLNRAPTLHSLNVLAFGPQLVQDETVHIPPFVCKGYNADFDGDAMAVHMPLSSAAQKEAEVLMAPSANIASPAHGGVLAAPSQDCSIGLYSLTADPASCDDPVIFSTVASAVSAYQQQGVCPIEERIVIIGSREMDVREGPGRPSEKKKRIETSYGRALFNEALPDDHPFVNYQVDTTCMSTILSECLAKGGTESVVPVLERLKVLGFSQAAKSRLSFSIWDLGVADANMDSMQSELKKRYPEDMAGMEQLWRGAIGALPEGNPVRAMVESGARGSFKQAGQITLTRGFMMNVRGEKVPVAVRGGLARGLNPSEFFITGHGAHKGVADRSYETSRPGEMTRNLVDALHGVVITAKDCGNRVGEKFLATEDLRGLAGRSLAQEVHLSSGEVFEAGAVLTEEAIEAIIADSMIQAIWVRTLLTCEQEGGVCQVCYGWDVARRRLASIGAAVGIIAAQSIGEPGTQLTMKTFHEGGIQGDTIVGALPELQRLLRQEDANTKAHFEKEKALFLQGNETSLPMETAKAVVDTILKIYRGSKVSINRKHAEVVARQMLSKVEILGIVPYEGAAKLAAAGIYPGALLDRYDFRSACESLDDDARKAIRFAPAFLSLKRLASLDSSFIAAASADKPAKRLAEAAAIGIDDGSEGIKGNHMLGALINAGTGFDHHGRPLSAGAVMAKENEQKDCSAFPALDGVLIGVGQEPMAENESGIL